MEDATIVEVVPEAETSIRTVTGISPEQPKQVKKKLVELPLTRVRQIIKMDPEVSLVGSEAVYLIAKSAELFINMLSKEAFVFTSNANKKTLQKKDIDAAVDNIEELCFLEGALD